MPDRLLTIGSDHRQLANTANGQTAAIAQIRACEASVRRDRFCPRAGAGRAIAMATFQSRRSAQIGVAADDRLHPDPSVRCAHHWSSARPRCICK
jgi:hypothetical protein